MKNEIKFRKYAPLPISPKTLITGWVPSKKKMELMINGREKELPGYWLYQLQLKYPGKRGRLAGKIFGYFYANKTI